VKVSNSIDPQGPAVTLTFPAATVNPWLAQVPTLAPDCYAIKSLGHNPILLGNEA